VPLLDPLPPLTVARTRAATSLDGRGQDRLAALGRQGRRKLDLAVGGIGQSRNTDTRETVRSNATNKIIQRSPAVLGE
jgi:hypothetical protein